MPSTAKAATVAILTLLSVLACGPPQTTTTDGEDDSELQERLHLIVPGAPGGGWDGTARGIGGALQRSGLIARVSYENLSGGGGGRAIAHLIATAPRQRQIWMVSSTPIILRSLRGRLPQSFRDLTPVAAVIGDYITFVVRSDSPYSTWSEVIAAFRDDPRRVKFAGGSVRGGMDHLVTSLALQAAGVDPAKLRYVAYDTGGKAMIALLAGETPLLTTGLGEAIEAWRSGHVRVLAITAEDRVAQAPDVPTLKELGAPMSFVNWRGFFAPPNLDESRLQRYLQLLEQLLETQEWQEVVDRYGWVEMFKPGEQFTRFLQQQEDEMRRLYQTLGMHTVGGAV